MKLAFVIAIAILFSLCGEGGNDSGPGLLSLSDDREEAIELVSQANDELQRIRILYRENNAKVGELKAALAKQDVQTVKRLADTLHLVIIDGYAFAESAKEKLAKAQRKDIDDDWIYYLSLKEEVITLQIKAFDYRRDSAKLFRDRFGSSDKISMTEAARKFKENESNFEKYMAEAKKVSEKADQLYKDVNNRKS